MFFFLKALISKGYVLLLLGKWWKLAYNQIHDDNRTKAQSAKAFKKCFQGFCFNFCHFCDLTIVFLKRDSAK